VDGPYDAPVSKVGQVSIPRPVRDRLGLSPGARVHFIVPDFLEGVALLVPEPVMHHWLSVGLEVALAAGGIDRGGVAADPRQGRSAT
jgi:AbrB family looped-hinge helix DNA binding protein